MLDWTGALNAGLFGGAAMTAALLAFRLLASPVLNLELLLGSSVSGATGFGTWALGLGIHLVIGAGTGIVYAGLIEIVGRGGWKVGLAIAGIHAFLAGWILPLVETAHPLLREGDLPAPGAFDSDAGTTGIASFVVAHLAYGAIVGLSYVPIRTPVREKAAGDRRG
jgi:hypothetical protein